MTRDRWLERALIANFAVHGVALVAMAALLLAVLPGGGHPDAERIAGIAAHPWRFRAGWLPWQLCAAADLALAIAMLRVRWLPRAPAIAVAALTTAAVVPDQYAQAVWITRGVELAQRDPAAYLALERVIFPYTAGWAITDVVYVNYLIPAERAAALVPPGLELQRLGPGGRWALFTFLTYRHGHFGPAVLGPLRRLLPSPIQTNWRIHVVDPATGHRGITFLTNAITSTPFALAARLLTEGMPMHVLARAELATDGDTLRVRLDPGAGTAPDAELALRRCEPPALSGAWAECFADHRAFLAYCVPQDRALSSQPWRHRISRQEIDLGIPLSACTPMTGAVSSRAAAAIAGDAPPLCFHVARVAFAFSAELHDRRPATAGP